MMRCAKIKGNEAVRLHLRFFPAWPVTGCARVLREAGGECYF